MHIELTACYVIQNRKSSIIEIKVLYLTGICIVVECSAHIEQSYAIRKVFPMKQKGADDIS